MRLRVPSLLLMLLPLPLPLPLLPEPQQRQLSMSRARSWSLRPLLFLSLLLPLCCRASPPLVPISAEPLAASCASSLGQRGAASGTPLVLQSPSSASLFQANFDTSDGSGHFYLYQMTFDAGRIALGSPLWDAGAILSGSAGQPPRPSPAARQLYTLKSDASQLTIPFLWAALTDAQRALLDMAPFVAAHSSDGLGAQRLAWLRGDRSQEGAPFRRRTSLLGDAVHGAPVYVGVASAAVEGDGYAAFYARSKLRRAAVYLGADDGMLHAFDAADGSELFAYIPNLLIASLNQLTSPAYVHRAYVDGLLGVAEAQLGGVWKTVLVSGLGGGAQGVFALDVSDPLGFAAGGGALWEFGDADDPDMGNVVGLPQIARFKVDGGAARYFAVVPGGLNSYAADGHRNSAGNGALFLLALDKARGAPWQLNVNYYRLVTPVSDATLPAGLGTPALVTDGDGIVRYAYAGDLQGNLWRYDFSGSPPWSVGPGPHKTPLFVARDASGVRQPITQQPRVVYASGGGYLILFGTGRMLSDADRAPANFSTQSYYAILDRLSTPPVVVTSRRQLAQRTLVGTADAAGFTVNGAPLTSSDLGWYVDFPDAAHSGERSVSSGVLAGGQLFFDTLLPGTDGCASALSRSYHLDALSGMASSARSSAPAATGVLVSGGYVTGPPAVLTLLSISGESGAAGHVTASRSVAVVYVGSGSVSNGGAAPVLSSSTAVLPLPVGRLSWREVSNWQALHDAAGK